MVGCFALPPPPASRGGRWKLPPIGALLRGKAPARCSTSGRPGRNIGVGTNAATNANGHFIAISREGASPVAWCLRASGRAAGGQATIVPWLSRSGSAIGRRHRQLASLLHYPRHERHRL